MKKTFREFSMILLVMLMAVSFSACSSDDDDYSSIVGTWYTENNSEYVEMTFKKDGTVTGYWKDLYHGETIIETDKGHYDVIKDVLRIWWDSEDEPFSVTFSISGNKMTTSENGGIVWTRKQ